jgi:hypothetical protein
MNTTFLTWLTVAAVVGGALLLFLGMPAAEQEVPLVLEAVSTETVPAVGEPAYWEPVTPVVTTPMAVPVRTQYVDTRSYVMQPCGSCGASSTAYIQQPSVPPCGTCGAIQPAYRRPNQPCGSCGAPQQAAIQQTYRQPCGSCGVAQAAPYGPAPVQRMETHSCSSCGPAGTTSAVPIYMQYPQVASCEQRVPSPCGPLPCSNLPMNCASPCGNTCPLDKPGINRNMDLCVEECTFVQLHTTIPHPICSDVRFEWNTSKGSFLEANVANPIYYVPTTQFADGEDVWVVLTITDSRGAKYTDQLKLHVINQR